MPKLISGKKKSQQNDTLIAGLIGVKRESTNWQHQERGASIVHPQALRKCAYAVNNCTPAISN